MRQDIVSATEIFRRDKEGHLERPLDAAGREQRAVLGNRERARHHRGAMTSRSVAWRDRFKDVAEKIGASEASESIMNNAG
ncbi:MAG: hypothetical protein ACRD1P_08465 [Thermoanaerobaculia bacterium]